MVEQKDGSNYQSPECFNTSSESDLHPKAHWRTFFSHKNWMLSGFLLPEAAEQTDGLHQTTRLYFQNFRIDYKADSISFRCLLHLCSCFVKQPFEFLTFSLNRQWFSAFEQPKPHWKITQREDGSKSVLKNKLAWHTIMFPPPGNAENNNNYLFS